ncbi:MAG: protein-L-isoaspartate O-methyltransferase [Parcubacteria group bacterium CG1_02_39_15]|uniref:Protein-L-isoaspartate O-methyltransferase n=1 Tax=Candidatus Nealsonbacteria bacterium CG_4_8_14_3_um_filter_40_11 TaxID=1974690 RepID=A0A2M7IJS1_9BACT|nr:MAG: protein-L-isoaspartate O-methyltransferase [Parcubacteria group bacterium CG1_02_39_15]PIW89944.1 MAG: protein-L-isoaspartate O-methyltransferase [Candidatus Nealsonbacteria bacterium CG_4_8_14_3_um_filter_40_11]
MSLIDSLIEGGWLKTPRIIEAFRKIKRVDFLPKDLEDLAELNEALPIGYGQTISQPLVVAFMIEQLQPQPGDKILDIGSGSGWTAALLAEIVGPEGKVIAIDIISELVEFGRKNIEKYNFVKKGVVQCVCADGSKGYPKEAPFDKILVSATAKELSSAWKEQLKIGGRIVTPINTSIWVFLKKNEKEFTEIEYPGFVFVPLISK